MEARFDGGQPETFALAGTGAQATENNQAKSINTCRAAKLRRMEYHFQCPGDEPGGKRSGEKMNSKKMTRRKMLAASSLSLLAARQAAQGQGRGGGAPAAPARKSDIPDTEWHLYGNDVRSTHYAALDQIDASNFNQLEMAWKFGTENLGPRWDAYFQSTPVIAKGKLYCTAGNRRDVISLDGETGELLWIHREDEGTRTGSRGGPGFGLSYWTDGNNERIVYATIGYRLVCLDAKTGIPDPNFGKNGVVDLRVDDDQEMDMVKSVIGIHAPPLVVKDTIVVGAAPTPQSKGYIRAYDIKSGKRKWIFHTIPRKGDFGYETWLEPNQAENATNTGSWAPMSADPDLNLVYIGVELPTGDEIGTKRIGSALFGESLVALDIDTGARKWHYQLVHHGLWDSDIPCASILCDIPVNGRIVKALAQPTKQSYLYVLNRETGEPIWPIPEMPVPKGDVPVEWYSPTQPIPSKPPGFDRQGMSEADLNDWTPEINARAKAIAAKYKLGPVFTPPCVIKPEGPWGTFQTPATQGGANWPGGSYDPESHMVYVYSKTVIEAVGASQNAQGQWGTSLAGNRTVNSDAGGGAFGGTASISGAGNPAAAGVPAGEGGGGGRGPAPKDGMDAPIVPRLLSIEGLPIFKPPYGRITALDLSQGTLAWQIAHGETPDHIRNHPRLKGVKIPRTGQAAILGTLCTKTLVICGDGGLYTDEKGRKAARLRAYDKKTGEEKGAVFISKVQTGSPITYMLNGRQYIVLAIGGSTGAELVAFRLPA
jgi:quinoprotein glucose dehydrogenase